MEVQTDIAKRLQELNKWQEEQKKLLHERQNMQREMLGMEQRNMYQMMGLLQIKQTDSHAGDGDHLERSLRTTNNKKPKSLPTSHNGDECNLLRENISQQQQEEERNQEDEPRSDSFVQSMCNEGEQLQHKYKNKFLKRGEGLRQRFKIDPEQLRINNLPPYKFASNHPSLTSLRSRRSTNSIHSNKSKEIIAARPTPSQTNQTSTDAQEQRFQKLLISSQNVYSSTPDMKSCSTVSMISANAGQSKVRFADTNNGVPVADPDHIKGQQLATMPWSKVLDSQQLRPISMEYIRPKGNDTEEFEQLSVFELLEQKELSDNTSLNTSSIKHYIDRKLRKKSGDDEDIPLPVQEELREAGLQPSVQQAMDSTISTEDDEHDHDHEVEHEEFEASAVEQEGTGDSSYMEQSTQQSDNAPLSQKPTKTHLKVRFCVDDQNRSGQMRSRERIDETASDTSTLVGEDSTLQGTDMFQQFKNALFTALQCRAEKVKNEIAAKEELTAEKSQLESSLNIAQATSSKFMNELQEKTQMIKTRLEELENEITTFKDNNMQLLKAKQEHEMEKAIFTQERLEAMDRLNDEKIQLEIYLHDERMKIETEKQKFEQKMRTLKSSLNSNERKEIVRLKQELDDMQMQLKLKEQTHVAAQSRLRAKIRNLEKEQKQLLDEIENLRKDNKRLQNDISRLSRENNNKMLYEINRNIAKLAPKMTTTNIAEPSALNPSSRSTVKNKTRAVAIPKHTVTSKKTEKSKTEKSKSINNSNNGSSKSSPVITHYYSSSDSEGVVSRSRDLNKARTTPESSIEDLEMSSSRSDAKLELCNDPKDIKVASPSEFKREIINSDGSKDIWYPNGNLKKISADGMQIRMLYFNKDIKETNINEGTVRYYYAGTNTWHTTYLDGLEILEFPNGQTEHRHKDGTIEVHFPNNSVRVMNPNDEQKLEEWRFADGTNLMQMRNGDRILVFPNGQKEIHTKLNKRREYPDGTVKLVYPDGSQETRYSNGRVRLKDKDGNLLMDSEMAKN